MPVFTSLIKYSYKPEFSSNSIKTAIPITVYPYTLLSLDHILLPTMIDLCLFSANASSLRAGLAWPVPWCITRA